jgi:amino acid transporter
MLIYGGNRQIMPEELNSKPADPNSTYLPPEQLSYKLKRVFLGPPLTTERLSVERLGRPTALAVLSSDVMSSCAYATEQMLIVLILAVGTGAYKLVTPLTIAMLVVLFFVAMSYLQVIKFFPKAGGSYAVSRETLGPRIAQIAASALLIDYTLTVAVSIASGVDALVSAVPALNPYIVEISVALIILIAYANLRGVREAGKTFAVPTYIFIFSVYLLIIVGIYKWIKGGLVAYSIHQTGAYLPGKAGGGLLMGASLYVLAKAFANGGSALTGTEAISNGVSLFKNKFKGREDLTPVEAQSKNARTVLVSMSLILGSLFLGISVLSSKIHPVPRISGVPTVVSQLADAIYGHSFTGRLLYDILQFSTALILTLAANTSFNGFPLLASYAAEDSFLPRQLTKRGHRLVFSNGIIVLSVVSIALIIITRASVTSLIALYAIGVYTGFTMAGLGMVKYHFMRKEPGWKYRSVINGFAAILSFIVGITFVITKFTEGAWVVVVLMPAMIYSFIRLHKSYETESQILAENSSEICAQPILKRHAALVFVERLDLATARAIRYARSLLPDELRCIHFVLDSKEAAELEESWKKIGLSNLPLDLVDCPDRRIGRAAVEAVVQNVADGQTEVSVLLPRRVYVGIWRRLLHDRTAERISALVSNIPNAAATIVPYKVSTKSFHKKPAAMLNTKVEEDFKEKPAVAGSDSIPIANIEYRSRAKVVGRVTSVRIQPRGGVPSLESVISDTTGKLKLVFQGRRSVAGIEPGATISAEGTVAKKGQELVIINPICEVLKPSASAQNGET